MTKEITALVTSGLVIGVAMVFPHLSFAAGPWLNLSSYAGSPGQTTTVSGGGFGQNESINVSLAGSKISPATADSQGNFSGVTLDIPQKTAGNYQVLATGDHRDQAYANFYIAGYYPNASPSSWYLLPGETLGFTGNGFSPGEDVVVTSDTGFTATTTADQSGNASISQALTIPFAWTNSKHTFTVRGTVSGAEIPLTVTIGSYNAQLSPSIWWVGYNTTMSAQATGFAPGEQINLLINGLQAAQTVADQSGDANFTLTTPASGSNFELKVQGVLSGQQSSRTIYLHS